MDQRIVYVGAQSIFCILFLTLFFLRRLNNKGGKLDKFDFLSFLFVATLILDCIWSFIDGVPKYRNWHIALQVVYLSTMAVTGYLWFLYTLDFFPAKDMKLHKYKYVLGLPVIIFIVLIFLSIKTNWMFVVDENGTYTRGDFHIYMVLFNYIYMLLGSYVALKCRKESVLTIDKRRFLIAAFFPVPILVLSALQIILPPGLPAMQGGVLIGFTLLYGTSQNLLITRDYLTGLPNRVAFEQDLMDRLHKIRINKESSLYLLEGDFDRFKSINDTHGHPTGDKALITTSEALKTTFAGYGAAVFRTGGDEFSMLMESETAPNMDLIRKDLAENLTKAASSDGLDLSMSLGMAEYDRSMDFKDLIEKADRSLYSEKKSTLDLM